MSLSLRQTAKHKSRYSVTIVVDDFQDLSPAGLVVALGLQEEDESELVLASSQRQPTLLVMAHGEDESHLVAFRHVKGDPVLI